MKKLLLWLDDSRDPFDTRTDWLVFSPIGRDVDIVWANSYEEFVEYFEDGHKIPDAICFDHDLGDESDDEKTGYDCAKYLIDFCEDNDIELPLYNIQSSNPVGKNNIDSLLKSFIKYQNHEI